MADEGGGGTPWGAIIQAVGSDVNAGAQLAGFNYLDYYRNPWNSVRSGVEMPNYPAQLKEALMNARYSGQMQTEKEDPLIQYLRDMINGRGNTAWE